MSRVTLSSIRSLTLYKDALTASRRGKPIQQLICAGKPCRLFNPDVVRCENLGGAGTEVDWKCEADLPESIRLGRVEVSCEGWDGPGDSHVLKGSCSLEYRLVDVPDALRKFNKIHSPPKDWSNYGPFYIVVVVVFLFILYKIIGLCLRSLGGGTDSSRPRRPPPFYPGHHNASDPPPPPYSKSPPYSLVASSASPPSQSGFSPANFATGAALGGLGTYLLTRQRGSESRSRQQQYDWERERNRSPPVQQPAGGSWFSHPMTQRPAPPRFQDDQGEGPSGLGSMRRSTGYGGSNVR